MRTTLTLARVNANRPDGVMEAYLSYIQMAVVRFHLGVQIKLGCKSRSDTAT